jgi:hypothetical protein
VSILYRPCPVGGKSVTSLSLCALAVAVAIAFAGCGGGSSDSSGGEGQAAAGGGETTAGGGETTAAGEGSGKGKSAEGEGESSSGKAAPSGKAVPSGAISDPEFVTQANEICEEGKKNSLKQLSAYVKRHKGESSGSGLGNLRKAVQAVIIPGIADQVDELRALEVSGGDEAKVDEFLAAMEEGVENAEQAEGSSSAPFGQSFKHSAELAHEYGLDACAYG